MRGEDRQFFPYDGRNLDPALADLAGEAVDLRIDHEMHDGPVPTVVETAVLKAPRWGWEVPAYLALGGIGGASATIALGVRIANGGEARQLERTAHIVSGLATAAGGALLVLDLGRPSRFYNMMRVFRPSSPMNVGVWILAGQAGSTWVSIVADLAPLHSPTLVRLADLVRVGTGVVSGVLGLPLAGYTGVLLGSTANPAWHEVRRELPGLFLASATSAGSAMVTLVPTAGRHRRSAELFGILGRVADLAMARRVTRRLAPFPATTAAWEHGTAGKLDRAATAGTAAALVLGVVGLKARWVRPIAGIIAVTSSFAQRFAVFEAGKAAAADPRTVYETQAAHRS